MKIEKVKLTQVRTNAENPRTISKPKFQKLMDSILALRDRTSHSPPCWKFARLWSTI